MKNTHMQLLLHDTFTQMVKTPLKHPKMKRVRKQPHHISFKKQTFNYGGSGALVGDQQVLMCASKIALH